VLRSTTGAEVEKVFKDRKWRAKSISEAINVVFARKFTSMGFTSQAPIFKEAGYTQHTWKLDFAKGDLSVEVAFNNQGSIAWNLLKPCLASELNHVAKSIQTRIGVIITATDELRDAGGFDGAIGTYERYVEYLKPLGTLLTSPIMLVGLRAFPGYRVVHRRERGKKRGHIERTEDDA